MADRRAQSPDTIDVAAYFARIGYLGPATATLGTLDAIAAAHVRAMPFNNVDVLLERGIDLDLRALHQKLVEQGRGGYCFEQNGLMIGVLRAIGFNVTPLGARVRTEVTRDVVPPRTHLFLRINLEGEPWLVDVGIGGLSLSAAIRFAPGLEQATPHERRRILLQDGRYFHQAHLNGGWTDVYEFTLDEMHPIDQELANWWTSTHPQSRFRNRLIVARAGDSGTRLTIHNDRFAIRDVNGVARGEEIRSPTQLLEILKQHFGLHYPAGTVIRWPGAPW